LLFIVCLLSGGPLVAAASLQQNYLGVYLEINDAQGREAQKDYLGAMVRYQVAEAVLAKIEVLDPQWETALVSRRLQDCQKKVAALRPLAGRQLAESNNEWTLDAEALAGQGGLSDLNRAQSKLTFMQVMRDNHPELAQAGFDGRIRAAAKAVDDLAGAALPKPASGDGTLQ
jgi:hypothetical protein